MGNKNFTNNITSLTLQLQTLMEGVGGQKALELLDLLSNLSESEKELVIESFKKTVTKIIAGEKRLIKVKDLELQQFEEELYSEIADSIEKEINTSKSSYRLSILNGGKTINSTVRTRKNTIINLSEVRDAIKNKNLTTIN